MSSTSFRLYLEALLRGTSQVRLARALGVSPQLVSDWKRGRRTPSPDQLFAIERALDVEPGRLSRHLGYVPADAEAAAVEGLLTDVRTRVRAQTAGLLRMAVEDFEGEHGALTGDELRDAEARLSVASGISSAT